MVVYFYLRFMYHIPYFKAKDHHGVIEFMHKNPFIILCGVDKNNKPVATHVPVLIEQREDALYLEGHVMRETDHHKAFVSTPDVLAIFNGPHTYVSASWYTHPQTASTWNYITVHAKGKLKFLDEASLLTILEKTTTHFENDIHSPALFQHLPDEYIQKLAKAIIAFEIKIFAIEDVFKLSQNRDEVSFNNIIQHLQQKDDGSKNIAEEMQKRKIK